VPIYVGEFSAARWTGDSGNRYLEHCLEFFEEYGWSWTYHSWREWHGWNAEMNNYDMDDQTQYDTTPRLELLKRYDVLHVASARFTWRRHQVKRALAT
jgi:hypothetical protein